MDKAYEDYMYHELVRELAELRDAVAWWAEVLDFVTYFYDDSLPYDKWFDAHEALQESFEHAEQQLRGMING